MIQEPSEGLQNSGISGSQSPDRWLRRGRNNHCLNSEMRMFLLLLISQFNLEPISDLNAIGIKAYIACGGHNNSRLNWYNNKKEIISQKGKM